MNTVKSKFRSFKIGLNLTLLAVMMIVLSQNYRPVDVEILFWQVHVPLVILLLGTAVLSAIIVFIFVLMAGRN